MLLTAVMTILCVGTKKNVFLGNISVMEFRIALMDQTKTFVVNFVI